MQNSTFGILNSMEPLGTFPNLIDQVHLRLVDAIADGTLAPGERLTQEQLAERLGVSRQPISHALQFLKRQGLVVEHGKRGLSVAPVDAVGIRDLYQVRAALDGLAARLAAERIAADRAPAREVDDLRAQFAAGGALDAEASVHDWIAVDVGFHSSIYALSGNPVVTETVAGLWPHFKRCMGVALVSRERRKSVWAEHTIIIEQILAGSPQGALSAAVLHTEKAGTNLYAELRKVTEGA
jgi:DNA-binding GntR family transcriptional regulator